MRERSELDDIRASPREISGENLIDNSFIAPGLT